MKTIGVIEDDQDLFDLLHYTLEQQGYRFVGSQSGLAGLHMCRQHHPDLILLDIMLPDMDGFEICKQIRSDRELKALPVIFLTARGGETDRVVGLELGANDYVVKPFSVRELLARIKIHLRPSEPAIDVLRGGPIELDRKRHQVSMEGMPVPLTATEFRLLEYLMSSPGQVFERHHLLDAVWGNERTVLDRTVVVNEVQSHAALFEDVVEAVGADL